LNTDQPLFLNPATPWYTDAVPYFGAHLWTSRYTGPKLLHRNWKFLGQKLGMERSYPERVVSLLSSGPPGKCRVTILKPTTVSFNISSFTTILPSGAYVCEKASLNNPEITAYNVPTVKV
jgi:hypothetical protein